MKPYPPSVRVAQLEAALRRLLRIVDAARRDDTCAPPEDALDGPLAREWDAAEQQARALVHEPRRLPRARLRAV